MVNTLIKNEKLVAYLELFKNNYELNGFHAAIMHSGFRLMEARQFELANSSSRLEILYQVYLSYVAQVTGEMDLNVLLYLRSNFVEQLLKIASEEEFSMQTTSRLPLLSLVTVEQSTF